MANNLKIYLKKVNQVYHTTFDPKGPGVVRIHLIPPRKPRPRIPWTIIINGQYLLPINTSWAVLLCEFIKEINKTDGSPLTDNEIKDLVANTINNVHDIYPKTIKTILLEDLNQIVKTLVNIARGIEPNVKIGYYSLEKHAKYMKAPHRIDLMISAMSINGCWNCNQKCLHCYAGEQPLANVNELTTEEWIAIIDKCRDAYIPQITFTGGEPTLREDLVQLVDHAKWFVTRLNTNGIRLNSSLCEQLYEASLDNVQITLYSSNQDIHNLLVGSSHFNDTVNGIKNAVQANLNVSINTPLCSINKDYLTTIKFCEQLGVKYFTCSGLIISGNAENEASQNTMLSSKEIYEIVKDATSYCHNHDLEISFTTPGLISSNKLRELKLTVPTCGACISNMAITANGDVTPCQSWLTSKPLGNILNDSWSSIWNNTSCKKIRKVASKDCFICQLPKSNNLKGDK